MTAQDKFRIGDRVQLSEKARVQKIHRNTQEVLGTVVGFRTDEHVVILRDTCPSQKRSYHISFWELWPVPTEVNHG